MSSLAHSQVKAAREACEQLLSLGVTTEPEHSYLHSFASGVYARTYIGEAGTHGVSRRHRFDTINILSAGHLRIINTADEHDIADYVAPAVWISPKGTERAVMVLEKCAWTTVYAMDECPIDEIEDKITYGDDL